MPTLRVAILGGGCFVGRIGSQFVKGWQRRLGSPFMSFMRFMVKVVRRS